MRIAYLFYLLLLVAVLLTWQYCKQKDVKMNHTLEEVRAVFHEDKQEIIGKYKAEGAGIGKDSDQYVIVVYVANKNLESMKVERWRNIPIKLKFIGPTKAQ